MKIERRRRQFRCLTYNPRESFHKFVKMLIVLYMYAIFKPIITAGRRKIFKRERE